MILIISENNKQALKRLSHLPWSYLGQPINSTELEKALDPAKRIFVGRKLNEIRSEIADNFISFIGGLSAFQSDLVLWYSSPMASKSISQTMIFHYYVYIKFLQDYAQQHSDDLVVVVNDNNFLRAISQLNFSFIKVENKANSNASRKYRGWLKLLKYVCFWMISRFMAKPDLSQTDALVHTWIDARAFSNLPKLVDSYLVDCADYLTNKGLKVTRITPINIKFNFLFKLKHFSSNIIYPLAYVSLGEMISVFKKIFKVTLKSNLGPSPDAEILRVLVKEEVKNENEVKLFVDYLLLYKAYSKINQKFSKPIKIVYSFENQPWEKMLNLAFNSHERIAFQHAAIPYYWMDYNFSAAEDKKILPQTILSSGPYWANLLRERGLTTTIDIIGALRYDYIFKIIPTKVNSKVVVVALPINSGIAAQLLLNILRLLEGGVLENYRLKIKAHPYLSTKVLNKSSFARFTNCEFTETPFMELLNDCCLLISSESTALYEAAFAGIRTVSFLPEDVTFGLGEMIKHAITLSYEDDFLSTVKSLLPIRGPKPLDAREFFSPPDYNVLGKYALPFAAASLN